MKNLRICLAFAILTAGFSAYASPSIDLGCPDYTEAQLQNATASDLEGLAKACQQSAYSFSMRAHFDESGWTIPQLNTEGQICALRAAIFSAYAAKKSSQTN